VRVAALYDIHAMPWALEAVLADVDADAIVLGGDYLYGPYPRETVAVVRALDAHVVRGNCEDMAEEWERAQLADGDLDWLQSLPLTATVDGVLFCHAAPTSNLPITTARTPDEDVLRTFHGVEGSVVIGHTHHQFDRTIGGLRALAEPVLHPGLVEVDRRRVRLRVVPPDDLQELAVARRAGVRGHDAVDRVLLRAHTGEPQLHSHSASLLVVHARQPSAAHASSCA